MVICAAVCAVGGIVALLTIRRSTPTANVTQASIFQPCHDACVSLPDTEEPAA
jgi:hypothetical protein